ncbi:MAG: GNAT family N-acetyltransferase, partial [Anaerolineales bacterium]
PLLANMRIRRAVEDDLREMEWEGRYKRYRRVYQEVFDRMLEGQAVMWVVELPSFGLIGQAFVQFKMHDSSSANGTTRAYMHSFRVRPGMRNQGVGTALMNYIEADLVQRGFQELTLNVAEDNPDAIRLYQRLGYSILKRISGRWSYFDNNGKLQQVAEPGYRLVKNLA